MSYAIQVSNLQKRYAHNEVVKGVSFEVVKGEIFGLLGVNGAGKTTILECIEGFRKADGGTVKVNGNIGVQLQCASLPAYIRAGEAVRLFAKWKKAKADASLLSSLGIETLMTKKYLELSTGQKRRLHLALALIGDPDLLFLDEPTAGLDVEGRRCLHEEIRKLNAKGTTIVLASHDMAEVEDLCTRIAILNRGTLAFLGTTDALAGKVGKRYHIEITTEQGKTQVTTENIADSLLDILQDYKQKHIAIVDIKVGRGPLEQHFIDVAKGG